MEYKQYRTEVNATTDNSFEGYASIFGCVDDGRDEMQYGAFTKTLQESQNRIKVLYMHEMRSLIGRPDVLSEDTKGLYFKAVISNTTLGRDVLTLIKDKVITEMSIGYERVKSYYDESRDVRVLQEVKLWEISPVTWGMNELAYIKSRFDFNQKYDILEREVKRLEALIKGGAGAPTPSIDKPPKIDEINPETIQLMIDMLK